MRVLITGAFGFVGTNLARHLAARGHELLALDVAAQPSEAYRAFFTWDQLGQIDWASVDAVVHLAGKAHDTRNASDPQSYVDVNVGLTKKLLESAVGSGQWAAGTSEERPEPSIPPFQYSTIPLKTFILFSSVKAVADRVEGVLTEEAAPDPQTPYGKSKLEAERVVQAAVGSPQSAVRCYILRPCMIHGPGNKGNLNLLFGIVRRGLPWPLGAFENSRSMASIANVCAAVESLLKGEAASDVYQVADDETLSTNEVVRLMSESLGRKPRIWRLPAQAVRAAARCGDALGLPLTSERLKKLTESYVVSNAKLKWALGWKRMPVRADVGLRATFKSLGQ